MQDISESIGGRESISTAQPLKIVSKLMKTEMDEEVDYTLYLGTITAIGSIFNSLRHYVINLPHLPLYIRLACRLASYNSLENDLQRVIELNAAANTRAPVTSIAASRSKRKSSKPAKIRRMINVNKCAVKKKRRKMKLQLFKCEHLAKLLLLESYTSTDRYVGGKEVSLEEGLGIGRLILKMLKFNEHMAVEELGQRTVDFMKVCIAEIQERYIKNGMKL